MPRAFSFTPLLLVVVALGCSHRHEPARTSGQAQRPQTQPPPPSYPQQQQGYPQQPPPATQPPATQPAAWPFPFPMPPGLVLPPPPAGWAIPGLPWPTAPTQPAGSPPSTTPPGAPPPVATGAGPDALGIELADRINAYRESRGLPRIPRSRSLGLVAATHVRDQERNHPDTGSCNQHTWSSSGPWTPCCYTPDHAQAACMWKKPAEIAGFRGSGYEISMKSTASVSPQEALAGWQSSPAHHAVMINEGTWSKKPWRSLGTAVLGGHAVAWFAEEADPAGGF